MSAELLPMVLDIETRRHKRELTKAFADLRAELLPPQEPPPESEWAKLQNAMANVSPLALAYQQGLALQQLSRDQSNMLSAYNRGGQPVGGFAYGGLFGAFANAAPAFFR